MGSRFMTGCLLLAFGAMAWSNAAQAAIEQSRLSPALRGGTAMDRYIARAGEVLVRVNEHQDEAAAELTALIDDPLFDMLNRPSQRFLLSSAGLAAWRQEQPVAARDLFLRATRADGNDPDDWYRLAILELELGDRMRAAQYMAAFLKRWPELANNLDRRVLTRLVFEDKTDSDARLAVMQALYNAGWNDRQRGTDGIWLQLIMALVNRGALVEAGEVASRISDPLAIVKLRTDRRFDPVWESIAALPPVEVAAARRVDALRELVADAPLRIDLASDLGTALLVAGRNAEALAQSEATLAAIDAGRDKDAFEGLDDEVWVMNNRAIALRRLGRLEEAVAELERASRLHEGDGANVSQVLNLGYFYCLLGRPAEALRTVETTGSMSGYGRMVRGSVLHSAALQTGDRTRARIALDYLTQHRADGESILLEALLRAGRLDAAARELIAQLESEDSRDAALGFVQEFRMAEELPGGRTMRENWTALRSRPDVQATVERYGRMGRHDIFDVTGID